ncbi:MAG: hypothetical protein WAW31_04190 [Smithella sp.]
MHHTTFNTPVVKSFFRGISLVLLKILGWKASGKLPQKAKYILIVAPHTSNWDLFHGILLAFALKAHIPILLAFIDYERKTGGAGPLIYPPVIWKRI